MEADFSEGAFVGDRTVLASLAGAVGLDVDAATAVLTSDAYGDVVRAGEAEAEQLDIHAVPTFVVERRLAIPGAQEPETFVSVLTRVRDRLPSDE